jgi:hypothetical protein
MGIKKIYLIRASETGYYKIGVSIHPSKRIEQLQTGNADELKLLLVYESEFSNKIEKHFHNRYSHLKREGEWFELSLEIETSFIQYCEATERQLMFLKENNNVFI